MTDRDRWLEKLLQAIKDHGINHDPDCAKNGVSVAPCSCTQHDLWKAARELGA